VRHLLALAAVAAGVLAGCGNAGPATGERAATAYDGPLFVPADQAAHPRAGAAGDVVECGTWGGGGSQVQEVYAEGATADSPEEALEVARGEGLVDGVTDGLRLAAEEPDRVLYVLEVEGAVKQAVVVRDGPATDGAGGDGWYVESWARCDAAELPRSWTEDQGLLVWVDAATGEPVPTSEVESYRGPEHCSWESMTFLQVGRDLYVREPVAELRRAFDEPYRAHADLPADAVDTGFERGDEHLWLSADRARAFVGTTSDVELWPRATDAPGCA